MVYISANPQVMQLYGLYFSLSPGNAVIQFIFQLIPRQCSYMVYILANPQAMQLYGGRMTAARLREVGSVTKEAIERLHK
jgi:hypothetical protein